MEISSVNPSIGASSGGLEIKISGSGFGYNKDTVQVNIGANTCVVTSVTMTIITCVTPAITGGVYDVTVSND